MHYGALITHPSCARACLLLCPPSPCRRSLSCCASWVLAPPRPPPPPLPWPQLLPPNLLPPPAGLHPQHPCRHLPPPLPAQPLLPARAPPPQPPAAAAPPAACAAGPAQTGRRTPAACASSQAGLQGEGGPRDGRAVVKPCCGPATARHCCLQDCVGGAAAVQQQRSSTRQPHLRGYQPSGVRCPPGAPQSRRPPPTPEKRRGSRCAGLLWSSQGAGI